MEDFQQLIILLEEIRSADKNFGDGIIVTRGFGKVYKGAICFSKSILAVKRVDRRHRQGNSEFWKEIMMLSGYKHENLISLMGFCEKILVYEHACNGSLDHHLRGQYSYLDSTIKICIDVASGLSYLNDPMEIYKVVIHRDIKSANILLDKKWNAKISNLGLSKTGLANQQHTYLRISRSVVS